LTIALDLGYYDYQHLVRDFKEFSSITPTAYFEASSKGQERAFGMAETYQSLTKLWKSLFNKTQTH